MCKWRQSVVVENLWKTLYTCGKLYSYESYVVLWFLCNLMVLMCILWFLCVYYGSYVILWFLCNLWFLCVYYGSYVTYVYIMVLM